MEEIQALLTAWTEATGQELNPRVMERMFWELAHAGYTPEDLKRVVKHLQRENSRMGEARFRITAVRVVGDLEFFDSTLAEARALDRNRVKRTPRDAVLAATGRPTHTTSSEARPAREVLKAIAGEL